MKHLQNREFDLDEMKRDLELEAVPQAVDRRLRQVYAELPDELPVKRHTLRTLGRTLGGTAASLAAAFLLLFGLNAANPAFAESIPVIGSIFQRINEGGPKNMAATQLAVQQNAAPVEGVSTQVPAAGLWEKPMTVTVREAYFDGVFLYAGLDLEVDAKSDFLYGPTGPGYDVLINGKSQLIYPEEGDSAQDREGFAQLSLPRWQRDGDNHYIGQQVFRVPEQYQDLDSLEVTLKHSGFTDSEKGTVNSTPFEFRFTVRKNDAKMVRVDGNGLEMGGVKLISAASSTAGTEFVVDFPETYDNPASGVQFADGAGLGALGDSTPQSLENGMTRRVRVFGGLRETEDRPVVFYVFDKNGSDDYVAVFVVDFQAGTVSLGSSEDVKDAPSAGYACGWDGLESFAEGYKVTRVFAGEEKNLMYLATPNAYREIRAEVYQDGDLLGSVISDRSEQGFYHPYLYWQYTDTDGESREDHETNLNAYQLSFGTDLFDLSKDVTVKIYGTDSGDLLHEETFSWNQPNP